MEATTCKPIAVVTEMHVVVEPGHIPAWGRLNEQEREKALQRWANDLMAFFRDHRSMDVNAVYIHKETKRQCSACGKDWELTHYPEENGEPAIDGCAYCALPVEK